MSSGTRTRRDQLDLFVARPALVRPAPVEETVGAQAGVIEATTASARPAPEPADAGTTRAADLHAEPLPDAEARQRIAEDLETNLLVEAGAGAGKTTAMVGRMVALVRSGRASIEQIAAVTFTRKAAAELRERFQTALEAELVRAKGADDPATATRVDAALRDIDRAFVGTIHSFCARLLRERPLDAGIDPGFRELMASEEKRLRREYWNTHVERLAAEGDVSLAELVSAGLRPGRLYTLFETLTEYGDVTFPADPVPRPDPGPARLELEALLAEAEPLMPAREPEAGWDELQTAIRTLWFYRRLGWEDDVRFLDALAQVFFSPNRVIVARWEPQPKEPVKALCDRFSRFAAEDGTCGRTLSQWYAHRYPIALSFAGRAASEYAAERRRAGALSFQDLLMLTAELLRTRPAARAELSDRYRYLLVDEFQDTDPVQAEVLFLLAAAEGGDDWRRVTPRAGALFVVGDPKQSIYRFRRADITLYNAVKDRFHAFGAVLELVSNFRSRPPIEQFVNAAFARRFPTQATAQQAAFAPLRVCRPAADPQGVFFYTLTKMKKKDLDEELARQDADRVASWIAARVRAGDRAAGDFMVLTRRRKHLSTYAQAIEARNLPVQVTGAGIGIEQELSELKLLLSALADPGDTRLTIAALVGLFFGLDYEQLAEHAVDRQQRFNFLAAPDEPGTAVEEALATLKEFWRLARREPADVVVARIVDRLGLLPFAAAGNLAESRAGALLYVLEAVRAAALEGDASLTGALAALEAALETEEAEAPLEPGRRDAVRLMNLHQAKGLEAPVVILAEPFGDWNPPPSLHVDRGAEGAPAGWLVVTEKGRRWGDTVLARPAGWAAFAQIEEQFDRAERDRLLYVAATRAAEELVVGSYDRDDRSPWRGFFPDPMFDWPRMELAIEPAPDRATLETPAAEMEEAVRRVGEERAARAAAGYFAAPVTRRVKADESGSGRTTGASPMAGQDDGRADRGLAGRGPEWGTAVHQALEAAGRGESGDRLRAACRSWLVAAERPLDENGEPQELDELVAIAESVTGSDVWREAEHARAQGRLLVETPFALRLPHAEYAAMLDRVAPGLDDGAGAAPEQIVEGVVDLAFLDDRGWTIVDYKSDVGSLDIEPERLARYRAQVGLYAEVLEQLTGRPVRERVILFTADARTVRW